MVSDITSRLLPQIEDWQKRPLDEVYPIVFIDAVHFSVRDNGQIRKLAAYVILAVSMTGHKEVLSIHIGENESAKYWLGVLNELKNRGVKDTAPNYRKRTQQLARRIHSSGCGGKCIHACGIIGCSVNRSTW